MSVHDGHRQRLKDRFCKEGLDNFNDLYVLELLLFYSVSRKDTNLIAHKLLDKFGTLQQVLDASRGELMKVEGVGEHTAIFLSLIREVGRYYRIEKEKEGTILHSVKDCGAYMMSYFYGRNNETVFMLCLDSKCKVLSCRKIGEGSVNSAGISIRRIVEVALNESASTVVLAHNHPSGLAIPSAEDIQTTYKIAQALKMVDVVLADHIVVSDSDFVSMVDSRYFHPSDVNTIQIAE